MLDNGLETNSQLSRLKFCSFGVVKIDVSAGRLNEVQGTIHLYLTIPSTFIVIELCFL